MTILAEVTSELIEWSDELMPWQRMILGKLLEDEDVTASYRSEVFKRAKIDYGFETPDQLPEEVRLDHIRVAREGKASVTRLAAIGNVEGANALRAGQELKFGRQLTVVYGENGSGKSGYARVLKKACSAKSVEEILPNVYSQNAPQSASCTFSCEVDGVPKSFEWRDGAPVSEELKRFAVCDSRCAHVYVGSENQLQVAPSIFNVFEVLARETDLMKERFDQLATTLAPRPDALTHLIDNTSTGDMLAELTHDTDPEDVRRKASWTGRDEKLLDEKQAELLRLKTQSPDQSKQALVAEKRRLELIKEHLKRVEDGIAESKIDQIRTKTEEYSLHDQAAIAAAQLALGNSELQGIGEAAWRELILAASRYSNQSAYPAEEFPYVGPESRCVLCQQPLQDNAKERLENFWTYLNSEASEKRNRAKRELDQLLVTLNALPTKIPPELLAIEDALLPSHRPLIAAANQYFDFAAKRIVATKASVNAGDFAEVSLIPKTLVADCDSAIEKVVQEIAEIDKSDISKSIVSFENDVKELNARRRLSQDLSLVLTYLDALKMSSKASSIADGIRTHSISIKSREMLTKYVTEGYVSEVKTNIRSLGLRSARAILSGRSDHGRVFHRIKLDSAVVAARPEMVLSEGERTGLAMACFLADIGSPEETPGIILDDPVTSLDHRIREKVVTRLVIEAKQRQVIVFTHDLVFYCQLLAAAEANLVDACKQHIESLTSAVGLITDSEPWDALSVGDRVLSLQTLIRNAEEADQAGEPEVYHSTVSKFYSRLRSTWERCIEELVINKVVERYDKAVKALRLTEVVVDTDVITEILVGWTRASAGIEAHDHAVAENKSVASLDDLRDELKALNEFVAKHKKRKRQAAELHKHLKG
jgi:ABC-type dipeptide/oligopeptide/nickel transport system ATPase subunit